MLACVVGVGEGMARTMGLRSTRGRGGDTQRIAGQLAARPGALSLSPALPRLPALTAIHLRASWH